MAVTQQRILIRRGNQSDLVVSNLQPGEPALCLDTNQFGIKGSSGNMLWAQAFVDKDDGTGSTHYEKYADGRIHEWGSYQMNIAFTIKYGDTIWFHSDTNDTVVTLPIPIDISKPYSPSVFFNSSGVLWCANVAVENTTSNGNTVSKLHYRAASGAQTTISVYIYWSIWGFWK